MLVFLFRNPLKGQCQHPNDMFDDQGKTTILSDHCFSCLKVCRKNKISRFVASILYSETDFISYYLLNGVTWKIFHVNRVFSL